MSAKTKAGDAAPKEEPAADAPYDFSTEKHGAQLLRRAHEDHSFLMKDYDEALGQLENEDVRKHLEGHLGAVEKFLSSTEKLFGKHYKDYPPLAGLEEDDKDLTEDEVEDVQDELDEQAADTEEDDKDLDTMDDAGNAAGSDSERDAEAPDGDEVVEGMEAEGKSLKAARAKYRKKAACQGCDDPDCSCQKDKRLRAARKDLTGDEVEGVKDELDQQAADTEEKSLEPHELGSVKEAAGFLGEAEQAGEWTDEHRFNSYHYHKTLKGIGQLAEARDDLEAGTTDMPPAEFEPGVGAKDMNGNWRCRVCGATNGPSSDYCHKCRSQATGQETKAAPGTPEWEAEEAAEPEHRGKMSHRKMCKDASGFFKELSQAQALDDSHRGRMAEVRKQLEEVGAPQGEAAAEEPPLPEPGEMGEKALDPTLCREAARKFEAYLKDPLPGVFQQAWDRLRAAGADVDLRREPSEENARALLWVCQNRAGDKAQTVNRIKAYYDEQERQVKELTETLKALNGNVAV